MNGKTIENINATQERGTIFIKWDGPTGATRIVSKGGQSMVIEAGKVYEMDCRNPILMSYSLKRECVTLAVPVVAVAAARQIGKKVNVRNGDNIFTTLKRKTEATPIEDDLGDLLDELGG
jgi:hypothetical protein